MPTLKLTRAAIEKVKAPDPSGKQVIHWDNELRGFGLLASGKTDAKTYIAQRRLPDGRTRRVTVGAVAEFARPEDARRKAGELIQGLREGKDPREERRRAAARERTLRAWLDAYLATNRELRPASRSMYTHAVEMWLEAWADRPLRSITRDDVERKIAEVARDHGKAAANFAMVTLRLLWRFAADRDDTLGRPPTAVLKRAWFAIPRRTRHVSADNLARFLAAVEKLPGRTHQDFVKILLFTGLRRSEAAALRWEEVDFGLRVIRLPAGRTKSNRRFDLPMSSYVRDLLVARRGLGDDGVWVFGADSKSGHIEEPASVFEAIERLCGIRVSAHDLRRTFVTIAESCDLSWLAMKILVDHATGADVTAGYAQLSQARVRSAAEVVCRKLMSLCEIIAANEGENVTRVG